MDNEQKAQLAERLGTFAKTMGKPGWIGFFLGLTAVLYEIGKALFK